jgi:hypothetical protein
MRAIYISIATAVVGGLLTGAAFRPHEELSAQPGGPRIVASDRSLVADYQPIYGAIQHRAGPMPKYVIGTDFIAARAEPVLVEATLSPDVEAILAAQLARYEAEAYRPQLIDVATRPAAIDANAQAPHASYAVLETDRPASATDHGVDAVETFNDGGGQTGEIVRVDHQGRGQVDNLAHGPNPYAEFSEPAA